jgi:holo-[acyl-carrier protein] synthase
MIVGIGCDIIKISRIKVIYDNFGKRFVEKLLTPLEIKNAPTSAHHFINYLAKRFAVKESVAKALGTGFGKAISLKDIEVYKNITNQPQVRLLKDMKNPSWKIHTSISDDGNHAIAYVIIEEVGEVR